MFEYLKEVAADEPERFIKEGQRELVRAQKLASYEIPPKLLHKFIIKSSVDEPVALEDLYYFGLYQLINGKISQALKVFQICVHRADKLLFSPLPASIYYYMGICYLMLEGGRQENAEIFLKRAFKKNFLLAGFPLALYSLHGSNTPRNKVRAALLYDDIAYKTANEEAVLRYVQLQAFDDEFSLIFDHDPILNSLNNLQQTYMDLRHPQKNWKATYYAAVYYSKLTENFAKEQLWDCVEKMLSQLRGRDARTLDLYESILKLNPLFAVHIVAIIFEMAEQEVLQYDDWEITAHKRVAPKGYRSARCFIPFIRAYQSIRDADLVDYPYLKAAYNHIVQIFQNSFLRSYKNIAKNIKDKTQEMIAMLRQSAEVIFLTGGLDTLSCEHVSNLLYEIGELELLMNQAQAKVLRQNTFVMDAPVDKSERKGFLNRPLSSDAKFIGFTSSGFQRQNLFIDPPIFTVQSLNIQLWSCRKKRPQIEKLFEKMFANLDQEWYRIEKILELELPKVYIDKFSKSSRLVIGGRLEEIYYLGLYHLECKQFKKSLESLTLYKALAEKFKKTVPSTLYYFLSVCCLFENFNLPESSEYLQKTLDKGFNLILFPLAFCYRNGFGLDMDWRQAAQYYQILAKQGSLDAIMAYLEIRLFQHHSRPLELLEIKKMLAAILAACPDVNNEQALYYAAVFYKRRPPTSESLRYYKEAVNLLFEQAKNQFPQKIARQENYLRLSLLGGGEAVRAGRRLLKEMGVHSKRPLTIVDFETTMRFSPIAICYARALKSGIPADSYPPLYKILQAVRENCSHSFFSAYEVLFNNMGGDQAQARLQIRECTRVIFLLGGAESLSIADMAVILRQVDECDCWAVNQQMALLYESCKLANPTDSSRDHKVSPTGVLKRLVSARPALALSSFPARPPRPPSHPAARFIEENTAGDVQAAVEVQEQLLPTRIPL